GSSGSSTDQICSWHQSPDRKGIRPRRALDSPAARRRGDRMIAAMKRRAFITLLGGAAAWSSVAGAQTARKRPIIGTFVQGTPTQNKGLQFRQSFLNGLQELGDIQGRDFDIIIQPAGSTSDLPKAAEQLVQLNPDVILAAASATALAAKQAT